MLGFGPLSSAPISDDAEVIPVSVSVTGLSATSSVGSVTVTEGTGVSVSPEGQVGTGQIGVLIGWNIISDAQNVTYSIIDDSQTITYTNIDDSQSVTYIAISTGDSVTYSEITNTGSTIYTEIDDSQTKVA